MPPGNSATYSSLLAWYTVISLNQNKKRLDAGDHATKNKARQILEPLFSLYEALALKKTSSAS